MTGAIDARPFVLESRGEMPDGAGGFLENWTALGTLWGTLEPAGRGRLRGERAVMRYRLRLRAAPPDDPAAAGAKAAGGSAGLHGRDGA